MSPIILTKYVVRSMMAEGNGRIVNIASIVAFTGYSGLSVYSATKASIIGFTRSLAREVGRLVSTSMLSRRAFVDTEMTEGLVEQKRDQIVRRSALHRLAEIDDVANAVEFLVGDKSKKHHWDCASRWMPAIRHSLARGSQAYFARPNLLIKLSIELDEDLSTRIVEVDGVGNNTRIIGFSRKVVLLRLERCRHLDLARRYVGREDERTREGARPDACGMRRDQSPG